MAPPSFAAHFWIWYGWNFKNDTHLSICWLSMFSSDTFYEFLKSVNFRKNEHKKLNLFSLHLSDLFYTDNIWGILLEWRLHLLKCKEGISHKSVILSLRHWFAHVVIRTLDFITRVQLIEGFLAFCLSSSSFDCLASSVEALLFPRVPFLTRYVPVVCFVLIDVWCICFIF